MGGDMVTALGRAASGANTLFGHNSSRPADEPQALVRSPGRSFALGEKVRTQHLELSQARQTFTAVGTQGRGLWGFHHGANEHGVAAGCTGITTRLRGDGPGLTGPDLVRLALERGRTAR
ncbi:MAG TPA: hypothetical protein VFA26_07790, partial [Gemmataceae bacterium]|nr:hypothetical protein [Gemmataceae bacterium]